MDDPLRILRFALERYPQLVEVLPAADLIMEAARRNDKRPAFVKLAVPDETVKNLRGAAAEQDVLLLVRIPHRLVERAGSRIILPGE